MIEGWMLYPLMIGIGLMAATGVALLGIGLYGFFYWIEVKKAKRRRKNRKRRKHLYYKDML